MYLRSAKWINAERELPLEHVSLEIDDNAVLGVIRVEMRDAVTFVSLYINIGKH